MGFKKINNEFSFADVVLESSKKHNRSLKNMEKLNKSIDWHRVEDILMSHYTVGLSMEGADAYPPLLLFKCLLLQKRFRPNTIFRTYGISINSDPELENQIYPVKCEAYLSGVAFNISRGLTQLNMFSTFA